MLIRKSGTCALVALSTAWLGLAGAGAAAPVATRAPAVPDAVSTQWRHQSPDPTGQRLHDVDMVSATLAWAVGEHGEIIKTTDGGATWRRQRSGTTAPLNAVDFIDAKHGWAMGNVALFTTDGGTTWRQGSGADGSITGVAFADALRGTATLSADFVYRTVDGGVTWSRQAMSFPVGRVQYFDGLRGVASGAGVARTRDGGATWQRVAGATGGGFFINFQEGWSVSGDRAQHTVDGGKSWQRQTVPADTWANDEFFADALHGWAVGAEDNIISTSDGGDTWVTQRGGIGSGIAYRYPNEATAFADATHGLAVGVCGQLLSTADGGSTWRQRLSGSCTQTADLAATDANHAWASQTDGEVLRTVDGGRRWQRVILPTANMNGGYLGGVAFVDNRLGWVVSSAGSVGDQFIFGTTDGGRSWQQQGPHDGANLFGIDSVDGQNVVAVGYLCCTGPRIDRSTDGGATWTIVPNPLQPYGGRFRAVDFATSGTGWIAGDAAALLKTTDGGATWRQQNPLGLYGSAGFFDLSFPDVDNGWVVGSDADNAPLLVHTTNGGRTWTRQDVPLASPTRVVATSATDVWVGGEGAVAHSVDGGVSWAVERPGPDASYGAIAVGGSSVWAGGYDFVQETGGIWHRSIPAG